MGCTGCVGVERGVVWIWKYHCDLSVKQCYKIRATLNRILGVLIPVR